MAEGEAYKTSDGTGYVEQEYEDVILRLISLVDGVTTDIESTVQKVVNEYMKNNPVTVDTTLTVANKPADAKTTGVKLGEKANGKGIALSIDTDGNLKITYDDGK